MNFDKEKIKDFLVTDIDSRIATKEKVNQYAYYIMILLVAILAIFVPPLTTGALAGDFSIAFPKKWQGWLVWGIINGSSAIANVSILVFFKLQAKKNSMNHPNYLKAVAILDSIQKKKRVFIPRSPKKMNLEDYSKKVVFIVLFTVMSFIAITNIIISFDILSLISTIISMIVTLVMSWTCMLNNEEYWTQEYLMYAEYLQEQLKIESTEELVEESEKVSEEGEKQC